MKRRFNIFKKQAIKLRSRGKTYTEIKQLLGFDIPKSTLSLWCKDVKLPSWYIKKIAALNEHNWSIGRKHAWIANKKRREDFLASLWNKNRYITTILDKYIFKLLLAFLYLGEGRKWKPGSSLTLGNSNPDIIKLYLAMLKICYGINPPSLHCRISYRADQNLQSLQKFWSKVTHIPLNNFYKTIPDPRTVGKPTKRKDYKGVCVISGGGTAVQLELDVIPKIILGDIAQLVERIAGSDEVGGSSPPISTKILGV